MPVLYDHNYSILNDKDRQDYLKDQSKVDIAKTISVINVSKPLRHFATLFPNNYLDDEDLKDEVELKALTSGYLTEIHDPNSTEASILAHIKNNKTYFIIASILKEYNFGHHETFIIPEFQLGNSYRADYLIIGSRSGGYEFIYVELEHPNSNITIKDGDLGNAFRKGIIQVNDWKTYLEENYSSLEETFNKYKHPDLQLPREFLKYDTSRIHFAVVAGLRSDFTDKTYKIKRTKKDSDKINLLHYDNLNDSANAVIGKYF